MRADQDEIRVSAEPLLTDEDEPSGSPWLLPVLILILIGALAFAVISTPLVEITRIEVRCQDQSLARELAQVVKSYLGDNLLLADLQGLRMTFAEDIRFEHVAVLRKLPHTLVVQVFPRKPVFVIKAGDFFYLCDKYGICYGGAVAFRPDLASVELPIKEADLLGAELPDPLLKYLMALSERLKLTSFGTGEVMEVESGGDVVVRMEVAQGQTLELALGDSSQLDLKLATAQSALEEARRQGLRLVRLDVSNPEGCVARLGD